MKISGGRRGKGKWWGRMKLALIGVSVCWWVLLQVNLSVADGGGGGSDVDTDAGTGTGDDNEGRANEPAAPAAPVGSKKRVDPQKVRDFVKKHKNEYAQYFSHPQLQEWFKNKSAAQAFSTFGYPRLFPFCVTHKQISQGHGNSDKKRVTKESHLYRFRRIFEHIEHQGKDKKFYHFSASRDSTVENKSFVESIEISRINTPEPDMINLRQWVHITVRTNGSMEGLYMQSIVGPFGLPFGEFSLEFPCSDLDKSSSLGTIGELQYCAYRPRTHIYHPSVYVGFDKKEFKTVDDPAYKGKPGKHTIQKEVGGGRNEWHLHFKWFDITCMETPYVQFLMIIVNRFDENPKHGITYAAQFSPVFLNGNFDSTDGSPYPYYPAWKNDMRCNVQGLQKMQELVKPSTKKNADANWTKHHWEIAQNVFRIQANEEYDQCILATKGELKMDRWDPKVNKTHEVVINRNDDTFECPPGPFKCDTSFSEQAVGKGDENVTAYRTRLTETEVTVSKCLPCGAPECLESGFMPEVCNIDLPEIHDLSKETDTLTHLDESVKRRSHGVSGMLSFLYLLPIANIIGRFYKEMCGKCLFGNGPWIFFHSLLHILALVALWDAMGPIIPSVAGHRQRVRECNRFINETKKPTKEHPLIKEWEECFAGFDVLTFHAMSGFLAFFLLHFIPFFGLIQPASNKLRFIMCVIHSNGGYFVYYLGVFCVFGGFFESSFLCVDTVVACALLIAFPIIVSVLLFVVDFLSDKRLGVRPMRKQWPVLEQLELEGKGPMHKPKIIILAVFIGLMSLVWILALASVYVVANSGDVEIEGQHGGGGKSKGLKAIQGIFGGCGNQSNGTTSS